MDEMMSGGMMHYRMICVLINSQEIFQWNQEGRIGEGRGNRKVVTRAENPSGGTGAIFLPSRVGAMLGFTHQFMRNVRIAWKRLGERRKSFGRGMSGGLRWSNFLAPGAGTVLGFTNALDSLFFLLFYVSKAAGGGRESLYKKVDHTFPKKPPALPGGFFVAAPASGP
ncbi:MAG: hypothetical protein J0I30_00870 [Burkholderiales bacterium]|nr:hypothetical protein [Burkholderiales bacterium]